MSTLQVRFTPRVEHGRMVTAFCDPLHLAASADTEADARIKLTATVMAFCHTLDRAGQLHTALIDSGVSWSRLETNDGELAVVVNDVRMATGEAVEA